MEAGRVLPVYVFDEEAAGRWTPGGASRWWLHHSLESLGRALGKAGAPLILRRGSALEIIPKLAGEIGAAAVHAALAHEPWARALDRAIAARLEKQGIALRRHLSAMLFRPDLIKTQTGKPYGVYTPFARACFKEGPQADPLPAPRAIEGVSGARSENLADWGLLPTKPDWAGGLRAAWKPGEAGAAARLDAFLDETIADYDASRDRPGEDGTSGLSPHMHFGELSPRQVWHAAGAASRKGRGRETFLKELLWREFSAYLLWHHPDMPDAPLRPEFKDFPWRRDAKALAAWQRGRTGIPIVDAGMRQLWQTGWMHNRVRMIVASLLVKHLLIPWQAGEAWFWDTLVDADLASNAVSWQWVAGCGADAAPFFRVFNPVLQGKKFDPEGAYVRRYVPELANFPTRHIHAPWEAPESLRQGLDYPPPLCDLGEGRERALAAFRTIRKTP